MYNNEKYCVGFVQYFAFKGESGSRKVKWEFLPQLRQLLKHIVEHFSCIEFSGIVIYLSWDLWSFTCAQEQDLVVPVCGWDLIHRYRSVFVVGMRSHHKGFPSHRIDGVKHDRVIPHKRHYIIWKLFSALDVRGERTTRTLAEEKWGD